MIFTPALSLTSAESWDAAATGEIATGSGSRHTFMTVIVLLFSDVNDAFFFFFDYSRSFPEFFKNFNFLHVRCGGGGVDYIFDSFFCFLMSTMHFFPFLIVPHLFPFFLGFSKFFSFACGGGMLTGNLVFIWNLYVLVEIVSWHSG